MKKSQQSSTAKNIAALAGGTLSAVALSGTSEAAVVHVTGSPVTVDTSTPGTANWDVDGANGTDFELEAATVGTLNYLRLDSAAFDGKGFLNTGFPLGIALRNIPNGVVVQAAPTGGYGWAGSGADRTVLSSNATFFSIQNMPNFTSAVEGMVGFRFNGGGGDQYGWAKVTVTATNSSLTVSEWAYQTVPGTPINVGQVPEPAVASLGLLAAGAAGLRRRRAKKQ